MISCLDLLRRVTRYATRFHALIDILSPLFLVLSSPVSHPLMSLILSYQRIRETYNSALVFSPFGHCHLLPVPPRISRQMFVAVPERIPQLSSRLLPHRLASADPFIRHHARA